MSAVALLALIVGVAAAAQVLRAHRLDEEQVVQWADDSGVELTPDTRALVARYLRKARIFRAWGGVAGVVVPTLVELAAHGRVTVVGFGTDGHHAPLGFGAIFVGYLLGGLYAEISLARPARGATRAARLVRRELEDYLPRRVVRGQRAAAVVGTIGALVTLVVPYGDHASEPSALSAACAAVAILALGAGLEAVERWLVRRPQPFTDEAVVAADDAIRAQSLHAIAGAGLALLLLLCCGIALVLQASDVDVLQTAMLVCAVVFLLLSLFAYRDLGEERRRVRRSVRGVGPASA
jgi:hypothetical protein